MSLRDVLSEAQSEEKQENELQVNAVLMDRLKTVEGYLSTLLKESTMKEIAITAELDEIKKVSRAVQEGMKSTSQSSINSLQSVNEGYKTHIEANVKRLLQLVMKVEKELETNRNTIESELKTISESARDSLNGIERETKGMISNARHGLWLNDWMDVFKYSGTAAVFGVALWIGAHYLFSALGVSLP